MKAKNGEARAWIVSALAVETDDCLLWPYAKSGGGYGTIKWDGRNQSTSRLVCELAHGKPPTDSHEAEHLCGVKLCCNRAHLAWATHPDNCARRKDHGTQMAGENHTEAKLTDAAVREIRATPKYTKGLRAKHGVNSSTIRRVRNRSNWAHVA